MERNDRISVRKSRRRRVDKIEELKVKRLSGLQRFTGVFRNEKAESVTVLTSLISASQLVREGVRLLLSPENSTCTSERTKFVWLHAKSPRQGVNPQTNAC